MKTLFVPSYAKTEFDEKLLKNISNSLPKNIIIAYSIQFKRKAEKSAKILSKSHNILDFIQVLGCTKFSFPKKTQAVLLIGSGRFHAISLAINSKIPVYIFENNQIVKISDPEIQDFKKKQKTAYLKFLNAKKIGVLISIKPGQQKLDTALKIKNSILNKKIYFFVSNEINSNEFENFPDIDSWINTACPRLDMISNKMINQAN